jgi:hypothetical protein
MGQMIHNHVRAAPALASRRKENSMSTGPQIPAAVPADVPHAVDAPEAARMLLIMLRERKDA